MIYIRGPHMGPVGTSWRISGRRGRRSGKTLAAIAAVAFLTWPLMIGRVAEVIWLPLAVVILAVARGIRRGQR